MIAKNITKLIDEAIIPAMFLILAKMSGLFLTSYFLNLEFEIKNNSFLKILPSLTYANITDYIKAENYSNLAMFLVASLGTAFVIVRAHFFHASHIHPKLHARLVSLNLESFVSSTYHLYHQAAIWLIFLWLTCAFLIISTIIGVTYPQVSAIAAIITVNFSWILAVDIEKEIELTQEI